MSYKKYINYKNKIKVEVCLDAYKNHLWKLINKKVSEGSRLKEIICTEKILSELRMCYYPQADTLKMAIAADNSKRIEKHLEEIKDWSVSKNLKCNKLVSLLELLASSKYLEIGEDDIDFSISMYEDYYREEIAQMAMKIESVVKYIKWKNYDIKLEAIPINDSLSVEEVKVIVEEEPTMVLSLENLKGRSIKKSKYVGIGENLLEEIKKFKENKKISTFYIKNSHQKKLLIEKIKKELILGQECYLPEGTILDKEQQNASGWRVRLEESNLTYDGNKYIVGPNETQIRFIEKI